jgi:hypothetical protein
MSRGGDRRQERRDGIAVLESIRGHDSTVAHSFGHTDGRCPKCGCEQQLMAFCFPDGEKVPKVRGCELEGEHLHRICGACKYPWVERPMDQLMLSQLEGQTIAEGELAAALAVILDQANGATLDSALVGSRRGWVIQFVRDPEKRTLVLTTRPPDEQRGQVVHPDPEHLMNPGGGPAA